ncbi:MAG TPA: hypothetical protein VMG99_00960 [Thermoplasmata archaeon]|nr:hypothetical protein [Thermoplasmata archaeon]HTW55426.1 hypothetical protein [Thermoplasmata archaeon]
MRPPADPSLVAAFGSETRVLTLAALANATQPLTAYRVAKLTEVRPPKVYAELAKLAGTPLVERISNGYVLKDAGLRELLVARMRFSWSGDWGSSYPKRTEDARRRLSLIAEKLPPFVLDRSKYPADPKIARRYAKEFARPPEKDDWPTEVVGDRASRKRR